MSFAGKRLLRHRAFASVPATTSNLGPGFDILGLALALRNEVRIEVLPSAGPDSVVVMGEGEGKLPAGPENMAVKAARLALPRSRFPRALRLTLLNRIPLAAGLGSSAAARLGGLMAARALTAADPASKDEAIWREACRLEGHPDNVTPAFYGGLRAVVACGGGVLSFAAAVPKELAVAVAVPDFGLATLKARRALPARVPLQDAVATAGRVALLLRAIEQGRFEWLEAAMEDVLHQPYRSRLVPGMGAAIRAAVAAGAWGAALSGAGPSVAAFGPRARLARIGRAMARAFAGKGVRASALALDVDLAGASAGPL